MLITSASLDALRVGFKSTFKTAFAGAPSDWDKVAMLVPSTAKRETYGWLGSTTRFREWLGDRVIQNLGEHDYTLKNRTFENTVSVKREDVEDDTLGVYTPMIQQLGADAKTHPDELVFSLFAAGLTATGYDRVPFFSENHPVVTDAGQTVAVSNLTTGDGPTWYLLDTTRPVKPFIFQKRRDYAFVSKDRPDDDNVFLRDEFVYGCDARVNAGFGLWQMAHASKAPLTPENYEAVRAAMAERKGDNGKPLGIRPSLLVVPPSLDAAGRKIIKAETIEGTTNISQGTAAVLPTSWLA